MHSRTLITATVTVRVPLHADGDLAAGARGIVERTDAVDRVETATVRDISPGLNDTTVDLHVRLAIDATERHHTLERSVGIISVGAVETVDRPTKPIETDVG